MTTPTQKSNTSSKISMSDDPKILIPITRLRNKPIGRASVQRLAHELAKLLGFEDGESFEIDIRVVPQL